MTSINRRMFVATGASVTTAAMLGSIGADLAQAAGTSPLIGKDVSLERAKAAGTVSFGTSNDVPYAFMDNVTGTVSGIDADFLSEILRRLGVAGKTTVQVTFAGLVPGLLSRHFDVVADSMWITTKREEQISFTRPWYRYGDALVVAKGNPKNVRSFADLKGKRVGAEVGTVDVDWLNAEGDVTVGTYPNREDAFQDLVFGRVDALVLDAPVAGATLVQQAALGAKLEVVPAYEPREVGLVGAGFRKEDVSLREAFDQALAGMRADGTDLAIPRKWGLTEANRAAA